PTVNDRRSGAPGAIQRCSEMVTEHVGRQGGRRSDPSGASGQSLQGRGASDGSEGVEQVLALLAGGGEDGGPDGGGLGAPGGAEATDDLAVDDRGSEVTLGAVVGGLDVVAVEEHGEAVAVGAVAL